MNRFAGNIIIYLQDMSDVRGIKYFNRLAGSAAFWPCMFNMFFWEMLLHTKPYGMWQNRYVSGHAILSILMADDREENGGGGNTEEKLELLMKRGVE